MAKRWSPYKYCNEIYNANGDTSTVTQLPETKLEERPDCKLMDPSLISGSGCQLYMANAVESVQNL